MELDTPLQEVHGIGPRQAERLSRLGLYRIHDLLLHLPLRFEDRTRCIPLADLRGGLSALFEGEIESVQLLSGRRRILRVRITAERAAVHLIFFHFSAGQQRSFRVGRRVRAYGELRGFADSLECVHPEYRILTGEPPPLEVELTPIYPTTEGISQHVLRKLATLALSMVEQVPDLLPELQAEGMLSLPEALRHLHRPPARQVDLSPFGGELKPVRRHGMPGREGNLREDARVRLVIEELCAHQLARQQSANDSATGLAIQLPAPGPRWKHLLEELPFSLTGAQQRVIQEIFSDIAKDRPMNRLLQGDVGSGKTLVAVATLLAAVEQGYQAAFMAPTELLARQHAENLENWLVPRGIPLGWLAGRQSKGERQEMLEPLAAGRPMVVVGTHALFQESVVFKRLAVVIIDEQHRFGVHQRMALREKGKETIPHLLIMTATPIPRTLAMSLYAGLQQSFLDERPPGRKAVRTALIHSGRREEVIGRIRLACAGGVQAYWVCPLIETSELLTAEAAEETTQRLREALPECRIERIHGRLPTAERDRIMEIFRAGDVDLLVATTVIEVGVDVPNASLMIIENAERMGLSQLHQLRGRVGRGTRESACVLLYNEPLGRAARSRLEAMRRTDDGFEIAEIDLRIRGPGEIMGTRQTGLQAYRLVDWEKDGVWLERAAELAQRASRDPERMAALIRRWLGNTVQYANVG